MTSTTIPKNSNSVNLAIVFAIDDGRLNSLFISIGVFKCTEKIIYLKCLTFEENAYHRFIKYICYYFIWLQYVYQDMRVR